jgi:hypothetical protein
MYFPKRSFIWHFSNRKNRKLSRDSKYTVLVNKLFPHGLIVWSHQPPCGSIESPHTTGYSSPNVGETIACLLAHPPSTLWQALPGPTSSASSPLHRRRALLRFQCGLSQQFMPLFNLCVCRHRCSLPSLHILRSGTPGTPWACGSTGPSCISGQFSPRVSGLIPTLCWPAVCRESVRRNTISPRPFAMTPINKLLCVSLASAQRYDLRRGWAKQPISASARCTLRARREYAFLSTLTENFISLTDLTLHTSRACGST